MAETAHAGITLLCLVYSAPCTRAVKERLDVYRYVMNIKKEQNVIDSCHIAE